MRAISLRSSGGEINLSTRHCGQRGEFVTSGGRQLHQRVLRQDEGEGHAGVVETYEFVAQPSGQWLPCLGVSAQKHTNFMHGMTLQCAPQRHV